MKRRMYRGIFAVMILLFSALTAKAQNYTLHSITQGVKVVSGGATKDATVNMVLKPNDLLIIPAKGTVSILDKTSGDIFTSVTTGQMSVTKLIIEAKRSAGSKTKNILSGVNSRFGGSTGTGGNRVYMEKGMVNRSLAVYDPDGDQIEMAPETLARYIAAILSSGKSDEMPLGFSSGETPEGGLYFQIENNLDYPVYFNVLRISGTGVEISPLGQPNGTYVMLPRQSMRRDHLTRLPAEDQHVVVLTPCQYDLDMVVEGVNKFLKEDVELPSDSISACVTIIK